MFWHLWLWCFVHETKRLNLLVFFFFYIFKYFESIHILTEVDEWNVIVIRIHSLFPATTEFIIISKGERKSLDRTYWQIAFNIFFITNLFLLHLIGKKLKLSFQTLCVWIIHNSHSDLVSKFKWNAGWMIHIVQELNDEKQMTASCYINKSKVYQRQI